MNRSRIVALAFVSALLAPIASAQNGPSTATFNSYGAGCGPGPATAVLSGQYVPSTSTATFTMTVPVPTFFVFMQAHVLVVGLSAATIPMPFDPSCVLLNDASLVFVQTAGATAFTFQVPASVAGLTLHLQGANVWFDTSCLCAAIQMTQGLTATFN